MTNQPNPCQGIALPSVALQEWLAHWREGNRRASADLADAKHDALEEATM